MKLWKEAATLILAARSTEQISHSSTKAVNYSLLCLKRNQKSSFMPSNYVFPGGVADPADSDLKWYKLFEEFGYNKSSFAPLFPEPTARPEIFKPVNNQLPKEISLRITAIRETFEECGILIGKKPGSKSSPIGWTQHLPMLVEEIKEWQPKVHNNATEFYKMCEALQCCPDLWSLYEWSNWLTPIFVPGKRFNAAFFLACLPAIPYTNYDDIEMEDMQWDTAKNFLSTKHVESIFGPPQQYELTRISKFETIEELLDSAITQNKLGVQLMLPIRVQLSDGTVALLPGDSMYPKNICLATETVIDKTNMTIKEFLEMSQSKNRYEVYKSQARNLVQCTN